MHPVLFAIGSLSISSFGAFLMLALLAAIFAAWKIARSYELNEEKIFDLCVLTFIGGIIGARLFFVAISYPIYSTVEQIIFLNRFPGLSLWGGIIGGVLTLYLLAKKSRFKFWQAADIAAVSFLIALTIGDLGCFLGGCLVGQNSNSFLATSIVGLIGKRFPIALFESAAFLLGFLLYKKQILKFHFAGKILAQVLFYFGLVKLITEHYRSDGNLGGQFFALGLIVISVIIYYLRAKRKLLNDLKSIGAISVNAKKRKLLLSSLRKNCYNQKINFQFKLTKIKEGAKKFTKEFKKKLHVKSTPANIT